MFFIVILTLCSFFTSRKKRSVIGIKNKTERVSGAEFTDSPISKLLMRIVSLKTESICNLIEI